MEERRNIEIKGNHIMSASPTQGDHKTQKWYVIRVLRSYQTDDLSDRDSHSDVHSFVVVRNRSRLKVSFFTLGID